MLRILYVDDEPSLLELAKSFLEMEEDIEVATCCSGHEVLSLLPTEHFDALVSDYQMPEMDGIELLRAVRHRYPALPFVLFTGRGREEVAMEALRHGADSYIMKGGDAASQFKMLSNEVRLAAARREAEEAVHYNLSRFNLIMRNLSEVILIATESGRITYVSPSITHLLGYTREEVEGKNLDEVWHLSREGQNDVVAGQMLSELLREEGTFFTVVAKDSSTRRLHGKATMVAQGEGKILIATIKDVTSLKDLEEQLMIKERLFSIVLDQMPLACGVSDLKSGRLFHVNTKVTEILGLSRDDLLGKTTIELGVWDPDGRAGVVRSMKPGEMVRGLEVALKAKDGGKHAFNLSALRVDLSDHPYIFWILHPKS